MTETIVTDEDEPKCKCGRRAVEPEDITLVCEGCQMLPEDCTCGKENCACGGGINNKGYCNMCGGRTKLT